MGNHRFFTGSSINIHWYPLVMTVFLKGFSTTQPSQQANLRTHLAGRPQKKKHQFPTDHCSWHVCPNLPVNIQQICSEFPSSKLFHYILIFIPKSNLDSAINQTSQTSLGKNTIQKFWCFMPGNEHTYCTMNDPINQSAWIIRSITSYIVVTHIK